MPNTSTEWNRQDRDLLIELRTEMKGVRADIKNISDGNNQRLSQLEQGKLDLTEFNRLRAEALLVHSDHEARIRSIEEAYVDLTTKLKTYGSIAVAIIGSLQIFIPLISPHL